jgi:hypothetical protein
MLSSALYFFVMSDSDQAAAPNKRHEWKRTVEEWVEWAPCTLGGTTSENLWESGTLGLVRLGPV